jgi:hypothetical protein
VTTQGSGPIRAFQWDLARQVERLDWLLARLPRYAAWGYQELYLHLEDAVEYPSLPGVARRDAYSYRDFGRLVDAAGRAGLKVVPVVNLLGHTQYLIKTPALRDLNELRAPDGSPWTHGQLCPLHPRTPEVVEKLLRDVAPFCTAGKVHAGLDESYHLGRHPLSRKEIAEVGLAAHFANHVGRLRGIAGGFGLRLGLWADMLALLPAAIPLLPADVIAYDWYYYPFRRRPRVELYNFAECDLAPALRARGIEYWGCPMSGAFRHEPLPIFHERLANIAAWWRRCRQTGAAGMLVTSWEPDRLAAELPELADAAAAGLWLDGEERPGRLLESGCRRRFGRAGPRIAAALRAADKYPFSGYVRWRLNDRWDTAAGDGPLSGWRAEARAWRGLAAQTGLPPAIAASFRFRAYLARRDEFVRSAARGVGDMRSALNRGDHRGFERRRLALDRSAAEFSRSLPAARSAARAMWNRTRDRRIAGPNERQIATDAGRLSAWRAWLRQCGRLSQSAWEASPVAGAWQLQFVVKNFAPAPQKVVIQQRKSDGSWNDLDGIFMIEFRARSAQPRSRVTHRLSVPVPWSGPPHREPALRIAVRGFGQVKVGSARLTDGVRRRYALLGSAKIAIIGKKAPRGGFPDFDWTANRGARLVNF